MRLIGEIVVAAAIAFVVGALFRILLGIVMESDPLFVGLVFAVGAVGLELGSIAFEITKAVVKARRP